MIDASLDVRPPLVSSLLGGVIGGALGSLARGLNGEVAVDPYRLAVRVGVSVVMSVIATVALSRKSGTQGFITVEDFYGAFVVGALVGYGGETYFNKALMPQQ